MDMPSRTGQKRLRPGQQSQCRRDGLQLDFLAGLRVIEHLGTGRPTKYDNKFPRDTTLLCILNFISLLVESDPSRIGRSDIAIGVSADRGHIRLLLAKANGEMPTRDESKNIASFIRTLRGCLTDNLCTGDIKTQYTKLISRRHLPLLFQKLSRIGTVDGNTPKKNWQRFCSLLPLWRRAYPAGERSEDFVNQSKSKSTLGEHSADELMVKTMKSLIFHKEYKAVDKLTPAERLYFTNMALEYSVRMVKSTFFGDVTSKGPFHNMLDPDNDHLFLYEIYRRINDVAKYLLGLEQFVNYGIRYIVMSLGEDGLERFLSQVGGITTHWVVRGRRNLPRALYWGTRPQDKIRLLLESKKLAIDDFEQEEYDEMAQQKAVTGLWSRGAPVTPVLHPEIQLVRHLQREHIPILEGSIGMNRPPCWPCYLYLQKLRRFDDPKQRWHMSATTGKPRGSWMIPPSCHPSVRDSMLREVERRVYDAVEEYGFDWSEPWAHTCC